LPIWRLVQTVYVFKFVYLKSPSVLWRCWLGGRKVIWPVKNWVVGCWRGCLRWGADLHIAQQMPLPLTISCSSKSRLVSTFLVLPFWYLLTRVVPDIFQKSSKTVVCVCVFVYLKSMWLKNLYSCIIICSLEWWNIRNEFLYIYVIQHENNILTHSTPSLQPFSDVHGLWPLQMFPILFPLMMVWYNSYSIA